MNKLDLIREDSFNFSLNAIELAKNIINAKILELTALDGNINVINGLQYVINKLDELKTNLKASHLILKAQGNIKVSITDVDMLIHKNGRIIAAFEQKYRRDAYYSKFIPLNAAQYITLKDIKSKLGIENYYYLISLPKNRYILLPLSEGWKIEKLGMGQARTSYALAPLNEAKNLSEGQLISFLREIIREG